MPEPSSLPTWARPDKKKPGRLATLIGIAVVIVVAILIGLGLTLLNGARNKAGPGGAAGGGGGGFGGGRRQPITVGTAKAVTGQIPITLDALGTVTPPVTASITSRISGNLMSVNFKEGQMVKKGQVLVQIDPRPYKVALEQARATQAHDEAILNNAKVDLVRYQTLLKQNSIASQQVDTQAALVKQDEAQVQADKAGVDNAKLNLDYTTITAPVEGRVGLRQIDVGNYISAGSTALVVLTVVNPMDVEFAIPEDNIPRIQARQQRGANLTATALSRDASQVLSTGELSTLDTQIDVTTGTVKAKARFQNDSFSLFPQQFVNVHLLVDTLCNQIIVPTTAVRHGSTGDYVYTVQPDKTAKVQYVKTGPGTPETISIQSGVQVGQTVITEGGDRLRDGSPVLLPGDDPAKFQAAQAKAGRRGRGGQSGQHRGFGRGGGHGGLGGGGQPGAGAGAGGYGQGAQGAGAPGSAPTDAQGGGAGAQAQQQQRDLADASCDAQGGRGQGGRGQGGGHWHHGQGGQNPGQSPGGDQPVSAPPGQGQWRRHQGGQGSNTGAGNDQNGGGQNGQGQNGQGGGHRHRHGQDNGQGAPASSGAAG